MSNFNIIKLNGNYTGYPHFKYVLDFNKPNIGLRKYYDISQFQKTRIWFWDKFGPSMEIEMWLVFYKDFRKENDYEFPNVVKTWSWQTSNDKLRIYCRDDETLSHLLISI